MKVLCQNIETTNMPLKIDANVGLGSNRSNNKKGNGRKKNKPKRQTRKQRSGNRAGSGEVGGYTNMPAVVVGNNTKSIREQGTDLAWKIDDISKYAANAVVISEMISTALFLRLSLLASTYQRIRWHRLTMRVVTECATTTDGGYAITFLRDPTDVVPQDVEGFRRLIGNQKVVVSKMWRSAQTVMPNRQDLFYTSQDSEPRWWSPAKFIMAIDHPASQPVSVSIYADWDVTLSDATIEGSDEKQQSLIASHVIGTFVGKGTATSDVVILGRELNGSPTYDIKELLQNPDAAVEGIIYRFPNPFVVVLNNGGSVLETHTAAFFRVITESGARRMEVLKYDFGPIVVAPPNTITTQEIARGGIEVGVPFEELASKNTFRRAPWSTSANGPAIFFKNKWEDSQPHLKESRETSTDLCNQLITSMLPLTKLLKQLEIQESPMQQ